MGRLWRIFGDDSLCLPESLLFHTAPMGEEIIYTIDGNNRITSFNSAWNRFAIKNEAAHLADQNLLGKNLMDFISGLEPRNVFLDLFTRIRDNRKRLEFPFRCDSPDTVRRLKMTINIFGEANLEFISQTLEITPRNPLAFLASGSPRNNQFLIVCSWCKKVALPKNQWVELEDAWQLNPTFHGPTYPQISHGMCPTCYQAA